MPISGMPASLRRLQVVAGEDAQTAGVDLHAVEQAVLHGKVGDGLVFPGAFRTLLHVGVVVLARTAVDRQITRIRTAPFRERPGKRAQASTQDYGCMPSTVPGPGAGTGNEWCDPNSIKVVPEL